MVVQYGRPGRRACWRTWTYGNAGLAPNPGLYSSKVGLSLAQMGAILRQQSLQLEAPLASQIQGWNAQQERAERGRILADVALQRVRACKSLSVDQMSALIRSIDASSTDPAIRPPRPARPRHSARPARRSHSDAQRGVEPEVAAGLPGGATHSARSRSRAADGWSRPARLPRSSAIGGSSAAADGGIPGPGRKQSAGSPKRSHRTRAALAAPILSSQA